MSTLFFIFEKKGRSALHHALTSATADENFELVENLIKLGANVNIKDEV